MDKEDNDDFNCFTDNSQDSTIAYKTDDTYCSNQQNIQPKSLIQDCKLDYARLAELESKQADQKLIQQIRANQLQIDEKLKILNSLKKHQEFHQINQQQNQKQSHWSEIEEQKFIAAVELYKKDNRSIQRELPSRSLVQVISHSQKFFLKLQRHFQKYKLVNLQQAAFFATQMSSESYIKNFEGKKGRDFGIEEQLDVLSCLIDLHQTCKSIKISVQYICQQYEKKFMQISELDIAAILLQFAKQ